MLHRKTTKPPAYQDFLDDLARGGTYGVFIDDTGSPGMPVTPPNFRPERKTWVAVIVPPTVMPEILHEFKGAIEELQQQFGVDEFHFADIHSGRRQFKSVDIKTRLALFEFMASVITTNNIPVLVQTFDSETLAYTRSRAPFDTLDPHPIFDFTRTADAALFFLLARVKWFMQQTPTYPEIKARVFIDEGFKKSGMAIKLPTFEKEFSDGLICFGQSSEIVPIQLADFAAFLLNRAQLIGGREQRKPHDNRIAQIASIIANNYVNLDKRMVSPDQTGPLVSLADTRPYGPP